jgi:hypothetical protein
MLDEWAIAERGRVKIKIAQADGERWNEGCENVNGESREGIWDGIISIQKSDKLEGSVKFVCVQKRIGWPLNELFHSIIMSECDGIRPGTER